MSPKGFVFKGSHGEITVDVRGEIVHRTGYPDIARVDIRGYLERVRQVCPVALASSVIEDDILCVGYWYVKDKKVLFEQFDESFPHVLSRFPQGFPDGETDEGASSLQGPVNPPLGRRTSREGVPEKKEGDFYPSLVRTRARTPDKFAGKTRHSLAHRRREISYLFEAFRNRKLPKQ